MNKILQVNNQRWYYLCLHLKKLGRLPEDIRTALMSLKSGLASEFENLTQMSNVSHKIIDSSK
jgi:hypothetical protein